MNDVERYGSSALLEPAQAHSRTPEMASDCLFGTSLLGCPGLMESSFAHSSAQLCPALRTTHGHHQGSPKRGPVWPLNSLGVSRAHAFDGCQEPSELVTFFQNLLSLQDWNEASFGIKYP